MELRRLVILQQTVIFQFVQVGLSIFVTEMIFTIFTYVQLFEVNQAGDGGGQVGQVVIGHAQLLQSLAVEELLRERESKGILLTLLKHRQQLKTQK